MNCFFYDESIGRNGPNEVILLLRIGDTNRKVQDI